jgi:hypothetical protein
MADGAHGQPGDLAVKRVEPACKTDIVNVTRLDRSTEDYFAWDRIPRGNLAI